MVKCLDWPIAVCTWSIKNDLEAIKRLCEGMVIHPVRPWVFSYGKKCYEALVAQATRLYHQYN